MSGKGILTIYLSTLIFMSVLNGNIWYVHPDSSMYSIQAALDSCAANDTVLVGPGVYYENIVWPCTQGIDLMSEYGPDTTTIDGDSVGRVITITTVVDTTTKISGFTIQNGQALNHESGGGILCDSCSPYITNNNIINNVSIATFFGGAGIACRDSSQAFIVDNVIANNHTAFGGGGILCAESSHATIANNTIARNTAWFGAGIFCTWWSSPIITENTIEGNICCNDNASGYESSLSGGDGNDVVIYRCPSSGGGICCVFDAAPYIYNNIINDNRAIDGGGICGEVSSYPFISDNIISGNTALGIYGHGGGICCLGDSVTTIRHNTITNNTANYMGAGICVLWCSATIDSCTISNNLGDGIGCDSPDSLTIHHNNISGNAGYGVRHISGYITVNAENNWWGHASGPYHPTINPGGLGDTVSDYVDFNPWLTDSVQGVGIDEYEFFSNPSICLQVNPNPFHLRTTIRCMIEDAGCTIGRGSQNTSGSTGRRPEYQRPELNVYDATGRVVKSFVLSTTYYILPTAISWNGIDDACRRLPSGIYFVQLKVGDCRQTEKLVFLR